MKNLRHSIDLPQLILSSIMILIMIITCLWVVKPFILSFTWAVTVVIATWPILIYLQNILWGKRSLAIIAMSILLLLLFIIPIALLINSLIDNKIPVMSWITQGHLALPQLSWLNDMPMFGKKLYLSYHKIIDGGSMALMRQLHPYIGRTTGFFVAQAGHCGRFMMNFTLMWLFSILLYLRGEDLSYSVSRVAYRIGENRGKVIILLACQAIRAVALGVVVTALVQGILGGIGLAISGIPYSTLLTVLIIISCILQIGPLIVLIPSIIWLYWTGHTTWGTILLIWSCVIGMLDNVLRLMLIRMKADVPTVLMLFGVIGGLIALGTIGLFIGPVVLSIAYRLVSVWIKNTSKPDKNIKYEKENL